MQPESTQYGYVEISLKGIGGFAFLPTEGKVNDANTTLFSRPYYLTPPAASIPPEYPAFHTKLIDGRPYLTLGVAGAEGTKKAMVADSVLIAFVSEYLERHPPCWFPELPLVELRSGDVVRTVVPRMLDAPLKCSLGQLIGELEQRFEATALLTGSRLLEARSCMAEARSPSDWDLVFDVELEQSQRILRVLDGLGGIWAFKRHWPLRARIGQRTVCLFFRLRRAMSTSAGPALIRSLRNFSGTATRSVQVIDDSGTLFFPAWAICCDSAGRELVVAVQNNLGRGRLRAGKRFLVRDARIASESGCREELHVADPDSQLVDL